MYEITNNVLAACVNKSSCCLDDGQAMHLVVMSRGVSFKLCLEGKELPVVSVGLLNGGEYLKTLRSTHVFFED